jgi:hypothetical protein
VSFLTAARFSADIQAEAAIRGDSYLRSLVESASKRAGSWRVRQHVLSAAVKINPKLLPDLSQAIQDVSARAQVKEPFETYVYSDASINAAVISVPERNLLMLSSAAVEKLNVQELDFVIGHELGHAKFGHLEAPVEAILGSGEPLQPRHTMQFLAWQRMKEISADRAGLVSCGSLATAATALFKTLSGLSIGGLKIDPEEFAAQWNDLAQEIARSGSADDWSATHPFPPLRMKALASFWKSDRAHELIPSAPGALPIQQVDREIESLLAMMDPLSRDAAGRRDPLLEQFLLWGGLYVASANGEITQTEVANLRTLVSPEAFGEASATNFAASRADMRQRFTTAKTERRKPLSALEIHRMFSALAAVARADGAVDEQEVQAMCDLARDAGVGESFVRSLVDPAARKNP